MAIKIGKWYITRNNPRELLLQLRYKQDIIDEIEKQLEERFYEFKDVEDEITRSIAYEDKNILDRIEQLKENK